MRSPVLPFFVMLLSFGTGMLVPAPLCGSESKKGAPVTARRLIAAGKYADAVSLLESAIKREPAKADHYAVRAVALYHLGSFSDALVDFNVAMRLSKKAPNWYRLKRGNVLTALGRFDEALKDYDAYIKAEPKSGKGYYRRGVLYFAQAKYDAALAALMTSMKIMGSRGENDAACYAVLCLLKLKSRGAAMAVAARALEFGDAGASTTSVLKYFRGEMPEKEVLERCKTLFDKTMSRAYLGLHLRFTGNGSLARGHFEWLRKNGVRHLSGYVVTMVGRPSTGQR